ncbi:MAG TPA: DUF1569 domain-containing protein [Terriglobales bacterium]
MDSYLQRLHTSVTSAANGMTPTQLNQRREGKWSVAEILEHLYNSYTGTIKGMDRCLATGKPQGRARTIKERAQVFLVIEAGYFPSGRKAPEISLPRGLAPDEVVKQIGAKILAMDEAITRCEARYGRRALILTHPILGPLTARQWRKLHWLHGQHHLKQITGLLVS